MLKRALPVVCLVIAISLSPGLGRAQQVDREPSPEDRVDAIFAAYDNTRSPGCAVGVIQDGEFVLRRGYGMANLEHGIPLSSESVFRIGSTSKQFTAANVLLLVEEGKVSLDADVREYVPELPDFGTPVTIRQLVHHTSGYRDYLTLMDLAGLRDDDYYTDAELLAMLTRQTQLNFEPGAEHLYSNTGYWLLSQVVERASGDSLREFAAAKVFEPLGMSNTHFHDDHAIIVENRASGYAPARQGGYRISMTTLPMVGDGGVFTTVDDLLAWDRNFYDSSIGSSRFIETMQTVGVLNDGEELDYAFGLDISTHRGLNTVSHGGSFVGFRADMLRYPDERLTVICLCNRADADPSRFARQVAEVYLEDRMEPPADAAARGRRPQPPQPVELSAEQLAGFVGDYYSDELDVTYEIRFDRGVLTLSVRDGGPRPLVPIAPDRLRVGNRTLRFERAGADGFAEFQLDAGRVRNLRFTRRQQ